MPVRARIIDGPVEIATARIVPGVDARIFQTRSCPFSFLVPVGRKREILIFGGLVLSEGLLGAQNSPEAQGGSYKHYYRTESHVAPTVLRVSRDVRSSDECRFRAAYV